MRAGTRGRAYLFHENGRLSDLFDHITSSIKGRVDAIEKDHFAVNSDDAIVAHLESHLRLEPLQFHVANQTMTPPREKKVDVSHDNNRFFGDERRGPFFIDGVEVSLHIPYTGDRTLWDYQPSRSYMGSAPSGHIEPQRQNARQGEVIITHALPADIGQEQISQRLKSYFDEQRKMIAEYVTWSTSDVENFNTRLPASIRSQVEKRRKYLEQNDNLLLMLEIPVRPDPSAPPIVPIHLRPHITVELASPPKAGFKPEYGIKSELYEKILEIIRHEARSFETTPETFNLLEEEQLRDVLLSHLNGHFKGAATAEAFRKKGKTDIRIEEQNRSAFVAECKVWSGQAQLKSALDQLLDYLIWRDCKSSLVIFNKNVAAFSELFDKVSKALREHELFISSSGNYEHGEWRFIFRSKEDTAREITVHVFLVNVYYEKKAKAPRVRST